MDEPVKTGRRQRNAAATRSRVLAAAETLFVRDGYASTTIGAIADLADVAVQTVFAVFGNKRTMLTELLAIRVVGFDADQSVVPLSKRPDWRAMEAETDPERQLMLLAGIATRIGERMAALYGVLAGAAGSDPHIAELYRLQQQQRWQDQNRVARALHRRKALRSGLTAARATDIMWALVNPNTYRALIGDRNWPTTEYEQFIGRLLIDALLEQPSVPR
jgi:AcrR family transcriptional regulator